MSAVSPRLLARGRAADVFEHGAGRVLRRYRDGTSAERETEVMSHVRRHGFPVPAVYAVDGPELIMERIDGRTMLDDLARLPWRVDEYARLLAELHRALHRIPPSSWLTASLGSGDQLLHLDLHPDNVMLGPAGPVVIDWQNAARGLAADDVAQTWVILATSVVPGPLVPRTVARIGRRWFLRAFLRGVDAEAAAERLELAVERRLRDAHLLPPEREALLRLLPSSPHAPSGARESLRRLA